MTRLFATTALIALAQSASAQSLPDYELDGSVRLGHFSELDGGGDLNYGRLDLTGGVGFGGGFGFDLDYTAIRELDPNEDTFDSLYATLTYGGDWGEIAVGIPQAARDTIVGDDYLGLSTPVWVEAGLVSGSVVDFLNFTEVDLFGASYQGSFGDNRFVLSYHDVDNGSDEVISLAYARDFGTYNLYGVVETLGDMPTGTDPTLVVGAEASFGDFTGRAEFTHAVLFNSDNHVLELTGDYAVNDNLTLGATLMNLNFGSDTNLINLAAQYTHDTGAFGRVDLGHIDSTGETLASVEIGFEF